MHHAFEVLQPWIADLGDPPGLPSLDQLNGWHAGQKPQFVVPDDSSLPYELQIAQLGRVPTRPESWHDAFNALCWLAWPQSKRAINRAHCAILNAGGEAERRTRSPARDVLTLIDEAGAVVLSSAPELFQPLREGDWEGLFIDRRRALIEHARLLLLGHALLDELRQPRLPITAKCLLLAVEPAVLTLPPAALRAHADGLTAAVLSRHQDLGRGRQYPPLPVLGWPGWHPDNHRPDFYREHPDVFRRRNPEALAQSR